MTRFQAYTPVLTAKGWGLGLATENEPGYEPVSAGIGNYLVFKTREEADAKAIELNRRTFGLGEEEAARIALSSMAAQNLQKRQAKLPVLEALALGAIDGLQGLDDSGCYEEEDEIREAYILGQNLGDAAVLGKDELNAVYTAAYLAEDISRITRT